ncbi:hypothetical protein K439DRAFT_1394495 [Ramaria rubella]|nr:hypothetical protein K439DRAFT_1394495 [Ramaria rubella]
MANPSSVSVLPPLSFDTPTPLLDSANGSTAQPSPTNQSLSLPTTMPETSLTFLMISGRRRTMSFASSTTIGRVKELVWNSWPADWSDERPPAPNYLRILYLGKILLDEDVLESIHNPLSPSGPGLSASIPAASPSSPATPPQSTIVHLSIRPVPPPGETDDFKKKKRRLTSSSSSGAVDGDGERTGCCAGCVIC